MKHSLQSIDKLNLFLINSKWEDGFSSTIKISELRNNCPCAICQNQAKEEINGLTMPKITFGEIDLKAIEPAGNYALKFTWGDRHNAGFYSWELLRKIFEDNSLEKEEIDRLMKGAKTPKLKKDKEN